MLLVSLNDAPQEPSQPFYQKLARVLEDISEGLILSVQGLDKGHGGSLYTTICR
jgi:hypothetical protein